MNKYVTDYDYCNDLINKPIVLAEVYTAIDKKGKSLIFDPIVSRLVVTEYKLVQINFETANLADLYYSAAFDMYFEKEIETQDILYDLSDAVDMYNSIEIKDHSGR